MNQHVARVLACILLAGSGILSAAMESAVQAPGRLVAAKGGGVEWKPAVEYERLDLTVAGPEGTLHRTVEGDAPPVFDLRGEGKTGLKDGAYKYEVSVSPRIPEEVRARLREAREAIDQQRMDPAKVEGLPRGNYRASGFFVVRDGQVRFDLEEREPEPEGRPEAGMRTMAGDLEITGDLKVHGTKAFAVLDPADPRREIVYVALEGPEAGTYYRGTAVTSDGEAVIELPEHFAAMTEPEGLTVQLTPLAEWSRLYVVEKTPRRLVVRDAEGRNGVEFDYLIQGIRRGQAGFEVVRPLRGAGGER